jgi:cytochrome c556
VFLRLIIAVLTIGLTTFTVAGEGDSISARKLLMKTNNDNARLAIQMIRGQKPYDPAAVEAAFAQWADTAQKLPGLFPDDSKTGGETRASPKIWQDKKDFDDKAAAFGKAVADNRDQAKASLDGLKAAIPSVGTACDNCHEDYRLSR